MTETFPAPFRVDAERLSQDESLPESLTDRQAFQLSEDLGGLAVWLLSDVILEKASRHAATIRDEADAKRLVEIPSLPNQPGACNILCARDLNQNPSPGSLRDSFFLPVQWRKRQNKPIDETRRLPIDLQKLADRVLLQMYAYRERRGSTIDDWELVLNVDEQPLGYDLSSWNDEFFTAGSGWGALAAGFELLNSGGVQDKTIAVSAVWDRHRGLSVVDGLELKVKACLRHKVETLFLSEEQSLEDLPTTLKYVELPADRLDPLLSLQPVLERLIIRPSDDALLEEKSKYYQNRRTVLNQEEGSREYYLNHLLQDVADSCRSQIPEKARYLIGDCRLITLASLSHELVELHTTILKPRELLPLYTPETEKKLLKILKGLRQSFPECLIHDPVEVNAAVSSDLSEISSLPQLTEFVQSDPSRTIVDLKPGTKTICFAMEQLARLYGAWAFILQNLQTGLRDIQPGHESPLLYQP